MKTPCKHLRRTNQRAAENSCQSEVTQFNPFSEIPHNKSIYLSIKKVILSLQFHIRTYWNENLHSTNHISGSVPLTAMAFKCEGEQKTFQNNSTTYY